MRAKTLRNRAGRTCVGKDFWRINLKNKPTMKKQIYRQGDVLIERIDSIPKTAVRQKASERIILAYGEATGHHHAIEEHDAADWWKDEAGSDQFLDIREAATITHQEHAPIPLPPGKYLVRRQREYSPEAIRNVAD